MTCARNHSSMSIADAKYGYLPNSVKTNPRRPGDQVAINRGSRMGRMDKQDKIRKS